MSAEIYIYDDIGPDWMGMVSAKSVIEAISKHANAKELTIHINSPGGDLTEAQAIYNAIQRFSGKTVVEIDGLAASAASYLAMAGDEVRIAENAMLMIHHPWTIAIGNATELRAVADVLDKFGGGIVDVYAARAGDKSSREQIDQWMKDETWMTAQEAIDAGLVDSIGQPLKVAAYVAASRFRNTPSRLAVSDDQAGKARRVARLATVKIKNSLTRRTANV